jgi:hypothetical protein
MPDIDLSFLRAQLDRIEASGNATRPSLASGGGGPYDPGMDARVAKLESDVGHIQTDIGEMKVDIREIRKAIETDFRLLFGAIIAAALGLVGVMAKGFHWL